jgi:hypothetical protein
VTKSLPCIVCNKTLENVGWVDENQPYDGTAFQTNGHYGSTFWDEPWQKIEINVCDDCLRAKEQTHIIKLPIHEVKKVNNGG